MMGYIAPVTQFDIFNTRIGQLRSGRESKKRGWKTPIQPYSLYVQVHGRRNGSAFEKFATMSLPESGQ